MTGGSAAWCAGLAAVAGWLGSGAGGQLARRRLQAVGSPPDLAATGPPARRRDPVSHRVEPAARQLPASLDLLAACLSAGAAPERALAAVGNAFDGEVGEMLGAVARLVALGAPVETAWSACLDDQHWAPVARAVIRAHYSGAALTDVLVHQAADRRRALRAEAQAAAQRASIKVVLPLGACFLPAFVLVGVIPVVAGFAHTLWS